MIRCFGALVMLASFCFEVSAQQFSSGNAPIALIELYTSEGCSSCPPADRWMSKLKAEDGLWRDFVPLAFHVDYWDHLGWADPFASPEYSQRQRRYASEYQQSTVYTPGVRKSGQEFRGWRSGVRVLHREQKSGAPKVGQLTIGIDDSGAFNAGFSGGFGANARVLNVAVLGLGLSTDVQRGENRGKRLAHDFVVLGLSRYSSATPNKWSGDLPRPKVTAENYAVAAWVSDGRTISPIQATGGNLAANIVFRE